MMFDRTVLCTTHYASATGEMATVGISHRPKHPDPSGRYLAHATVGGSPWSAKCRSYEEAQRQIHTWKQGLVGDGYRLIDPFDEDSTLRGENP